MSDIESSGPSDGGEDICDSVEGDVDYFIQVLNEFREDTRISEKCFEYIIHCAKHCNNDGIFFEGNHPKNFECPAQKKLNRILTPQIFSFATGEGIDLVDIPFRGFIGNEVAELKYPDFFAGIFPFFHEETLPLYQDITQTSAVSEAFECHGRIMEFPYVSYCVAIHTICLTAREANRIVWEKIEGSDPIEFLFKYKEFELPAPLT